MRLVVSLAAFLCVGLEFSPVFAQDLQVEDNGSSISVTDKGQPVLGYVYRAEEPAHSNYLHPLHGLFGEVITGDSPSNWSGAPGISWGWTRLGAAGRAIDLSAGEGGKRIFERITAGSSSPDQAWFGLQNAWVSDPDGTAHVLENIEVIAGKVDKSQRVIDLTVLLRSVSTEKIYVEGAIPGSGLGLQLNSERNDWAVTGAQGDLGPQAAPYLSPWVVCSYRDDRRSTRSGLVVLQDTRNPGFSQPNWLIENPNRLSAGVPESVKVELRPGQTLEFRYRFILYHLGGSRVDMTAEYARFMSEGRRQE